MKKVKHRHRWQFTSIESMKYLHFVCECGLVKSEKVRFLK